MNPLSDVSGGRRRRSSKGRRSSGRPPRGRDTASRIEFIPPAVLIVFALLLGGSANPLCDLIVEWVAVIVLAILAIRFTPEEWRRTRLGWLAIGVALLIAAIEVTPLPYALWRTLPGRQSAAAVFDSLSLSGGARGLSLDPNATIATLIQCLPGLAAFVAALGARRASRRIWTALIIAGGVAGMLLGALQTAAQGRFYLYDNSDAGYLTGQFANHNHAADLFLIGIALLAGRLKIADPRRAGLRVLIVTLMLAMAVAILLTASRFGIALLLVEIALIAIIARGGLGGRKWIPAAIVACVCIAVAAALLFVPSIGRALSRFNDFSHDLRTEFWAQTVFAAWHYWPVGSGLGTFVPIYATIERLDTLPPQIVNHAHNEYLELILELGVIGVALIAGYLVGFATIVARRLKATFDPDLAAAALGIGVLLVHSVVEFPLRNEALMVSFGILNGIVFGALQQKSAPAP